VRFHLDFATLREKLPMIGAKRLILTHMSPDMLGRVSELKDCEAAHTGWKLKSADRLDWVETCGQGQTLQVV